MIIIRDVPGLTTLDTLTELNEISSSGIVTGHGGFVVSEETAYTFLKAYLTMLGTLQPEKAEPEPAEIPTVPARRGRKTV